MTRWTCLPIVVALAGVMPVAFNAPTSLANEGQASPEAPAAPCVACEEGTCDGEACQAPATEAPATADQPADRSAELATPTHRQTKIIKANQGDLPQTKLNCFCMTTDGRILAGCGTSSENGEIRVFDALGNYVETWSTPVKVEAVNVRASDGMVFVAGGGQLVKLDASGALVDQKESPHASVSKEQAAKIRESVVQQMKQRVELYRQQAKIYDQQIELVGGQIEKLDKQIESLDEAEEAEENSAAQLAAYKQQREQLQQSHDSFTQTRKLWDERIEQLGDSEPTDEEIAAQVESQVARKLAVASISAVGETVYIACSSAVGYGYSVWAIDETFESGEEIVTELRGCCGQMDVQASDKGIYVAENARMRVACFGPDGTQLRQWGHSAREGVEGFGSCCNPMNVAFGPNSTVYTAESGTGRIKQYSSDGELLQVIGSADIVPGCKKVSIGVGTDGSRVFMLDITRDHIVMMEPIPADERAEMVAQTAAGESSPSTTDRSVPIGTVTPSTEAQTQPSSTSAVLRVLLSPFSSSD